MPLVVALLIAAAAVDKIVTAVGTKIPIVAGMLVAATAFAAGISYNYTATCMAVIGVWFVVDADILTLAPTHVVSTALAGRTNAGPGCRCLARPDRDPDRQHPDQIHQIVDLVFFWGILIDRSAARPGRVAVPEALIHRTVREFGKAIALLDAGARPADGGDPTELRVALTGNVTALESTL